MNEQRKDLESNSLPEHARKILADAYARARKLPEGSKERTLEIEYAIEYVRNNWPSFFKVD